MTLVDSVIKYEATIKVNINDKRIYFESEDYSIQDFDCALDYATDDGTFLIHAGSGSISYYQLKDKKLIYSSYSSSPFGNSPIFYSTYFTSQ